jgi:uncharacterized phiE125 gp8 family phage protein
MDGPITIDDARLHMRVDTHDEDENIGRLIKVAARQIETVYGLVSVQREARFSFDCFAREMRIPLIPVKADSIVLHYLDSAGVEQTFVDFRSFVRYDWTWLTPAVGSRWPTAAAVPGAITVTATVGFIDQDQTPTEQMSSVPVDLQQAARLLVEHLFLRSGGSMPAGMDDLIEHYRFRRV